MARLVEPSQCHTLLPVLHASIGAATCLRHIILGQRFLTLEAEEHHTIRAGVAKLQFTVSLVLPGTVLSAALIFRNAVKVLWR